MAKKGFIIALDGPDGVGKTTQVQRLVAGLEAAGHHVHQTRSSGGTPIGEALREVSLSNHPRPTETDLYISLAMGAALAEDLRARKARGEVVIIDRSPLALVAYNGFGGQLKDTQRAYDACLQLLEGYQIDLLLYLEAPQTVLDERRQERGTNDYFESQGAAFHERVLQGYAAAMDYVKQHHPSAMHIATIDASPSVEEITVNIQHIVEDKMA